MDDFVKPALGYAELWPMLVVFGVACLGVLVEAFVARHQRYLIQVGISLVGLLVALGGTIYVGMNLGDLRSEEIKDADGNVVQAA